MLLCICKVQSISIHALREEGDSQGCGVRSVPVNFYPRPPRGGRLFLPHLWIPATDNFYPRPPRGGRLLAIREIGSRTSISIHALREEGDLGFILLSVGVRKISIHALREEGDATGTLGTSGRGNFYPRPPRGGRPAQNAISVTMWTFLSTPSARRATSCGITILPSVRFLSTPSARRATLCLTRTMPKSSHFYPRPPRGGRLLKQLDYDRKPIFLSTPSARRATGALWDKILQN